MNYLQGVFTSYFCPAYQPVLRGRGAREKERKDTPSSSTATSAPQKRLILRLSYLRRFLWMTPSAEFFLYLVLNLARELVASNSLMFSHVPSTELKAQTHETACNLAPRVAVLELSLLPVICTVWKTDHNRKPMTGSFEVLVSSSAYSKERGLQVRDWTACRLCVGEARRRKNDLTWRQEKERHDETAICSQSFSKLIFTLTSHKWLSKLLSFLIILLTRLKAHSGIEVSVKIRSWSVLKGEQCSLLNPPSCHVDKL